MSKTLREQYLSNPGLVLSEFKEEDVITLTNTLKSTANQILCKYGYMQPTDKPHDQLTKEEISLRGYDKYSLKEVFERMPNEVKTMFWAVNNAGYLLRIEKEFRDSQTEEIKRNRAEILKYQLEIMELQEKVFNLEIKNI